MSTNNPEVLNELSKSADSLTRPSAGSSTWMAGFFLLGILLGMLGSLVIVWQYHIDVEPRSIGFHFLGMGAGFVLAWQLVPRLLGQVPVRTIGIFATALSLLSLLALAWLSPPFDAAWRISVLSIAGVAAGSLTYALFHANQARFEAAPAASANHAGALFVAGGFAATALVGLTYFCGSIQIQTLVLSVVPASYLVVLLLNRFAPALGEPFHDRDDPSQDTLKDLRSIATLLFSLLIFFQFACEWAIVGWLPLFLTHTLGLSPVTAIWALGLYFSALMIGRLAAQLLLPIVSHKRMLLVSIAAAMVGYLLLTMTGFTILALLAAIIIGLGHAPIYPLIAERLDHRFSYHAGFYSSAISFAMAGAMATPWLLGYVAQYLGMRAVMLIPSIASVVVLLLAILIMLEARLMGGKQDDTHHGLLASDI